MADADATPTSPTAASPRRRLHEQLDPAARWESGLSTINSIIVVLILVSVVLAVVESEPVISQGRERLLHGLELAIGAVFLVEYVARVWVCVENPEHGPGWRGRLHYMRSPAAVLDLLALAPTIVGIFGAEPFLLRMLRLFRVLRLARLGRFSVAVIALSEAVRDRQYELFSSMCLGLVVLLLTSTLMYLVEGGRQPETFGSIPRAMWWSVVTLTTVGYGDAVPLTPFGKVLTGITAVSGIMLVAMPTGILAAAFSDAMQRHRRHHEEHLPRHRGHGHAHDHSEPCDSGQGTQQSGSGAPGS